MIKFEKRNTISKKLTIFISLISIFIALPFIALIFILYGIDPILAFQRILYGAFGNTYSLSETITKSIPLILCSVGLSLAFKTIFYNIGAEGQLLIGAIFGTGIALSLPNLTSFLLIPLMFIFGFLGGLIWSIIPLLLKVKFQTNEVITTLMMNYIAINFLEYLLYGPWKGKEEWGFPYTSTFSASAQLPTLGASRIHYVTLIIGLTVAFFIYILLTRTKWGLEIQIIGKNVEVAKYLGINHVKLLALVVFLSGGLAGVAGIGEVAGIHHRLRIGISPGYGFTSIIVAWLSRLNPLVSIIVSILFGGLIVGGEMIQISLGLPSGIINIFNGIFLFSTLASEFFIRNKISIKIDKKIEFQRRD